MDKALFDRSEMGGKVMRGVSCIRRLFVPDPAATQDRSRASAPGAGNVSAILVPFQPGLFMRRSAAHTRTTDDAWHINPKRKPDIDGRSGFRQYTVEAPLSGD
jgi:hypothetical protein